MPSAYVYLPYHSYKSRLIPGSDLKECWLNIHILSAKLPVSQTACWLSLEHLITQEIEGRLMMK